MRIIKHSEMKHDLSFEKMFSFNEFKFTYGFSFPCNQWGKLLPNASEELKENFDKCASGVIDGTPIYDLGLRISRHTYREPAIGECVCGREVSLGGFTNSCDCGRDYNWAGQELAPREFWGEETLESIGDILGIR